MYESTPAHTRTSTSGTTGSIDVNALRDAAEALFEQSILGLWKDARNVWRTAWAMDTLLDYFSILDVDASAYESIAVDALNPVHKGAWWDDFGWIGIAALRAAEMNTFPAHRDTFVKIAINAWAYMHGPGWSASSTDVYPFRDVEGWAEFANEHSGNRGAANVWNDIEQTWPDVTREEKASLRPRHAPGGAWNSPLQADSHPQTSPVYSGQCNYLNPVQNTVTNGLYAILSLRINQAADKPQFKSLFDQSTLDTHASRNAWKNQIEWLNQWMTETPDPVQSLMYTLDNGSLVRERVSTFHPVDQQLLWDMAYRKHLVWTGDQGLLIGALRESRNGHLPTPRPKVLECFPDLIKGTFNHAFADRTYGQVRGSFPLPWLVVHSENPYEAASPGNDNADYQTGVGVWMRYLLQAYRADPALLDPYRDTINTLAANIAKMGTESRPHVEPAGCCDAFTPYEDSCGVDADPANTFIAFVNRLSVLLLAIEMNH